MSQKSSDIMRRRTDLNCIAKRSVTYADSTPLSMYVCVCIGETERGGGDAENILIHVHVTIQHRNDIVNSHSHLLIRSLIVTREPYRVSTYFLGSVPPGICSLAGSASAIARNRAKVF